MLRELSQPRESTEAGAIPGGVMRVRGSPTCQTVRSM